MEGASLPDFLIDKGTLFTWRYSQLHGYTLYKTMREIFLRYFLYFAGRLAGAFAVIRAFSWQLRLSPMAFEEFCAALSLPQSSPLMDEIFLCILRTFAQDENSEIRGTRVLDLDRLDHLTWPEFVWEWFRLTGNSLSKHYTDAPVNVSDSQNNEVSLCIKLQPSQPFCDTSLSNHKCISYRACETSEAIVIAHLVAVHL